MSYREISDVQDKRVSKKLKMKIQKNSGAMIGRKGDLYTDLILSETKTLAKTSNRFSVKIKWLDKIKKEAFTMNKPIHMLIFSFGDGLDYVCITDQMWRSLLALYEENTGENFIYCGLHVQSLHPNQKSFSVYLEDINEARRGSEEYDGFFLEYRSFEKPQTECYYLVTDLEIIEKLLSKEVLDENKP